MMLMKKKPYEEGVQSFDRLWGALDLLFVVEKDMKLLGLSIGPKGVSIPFSPQFVCQFVCHQPLKANSLVF
jgi:hypothetical protein